jgi:GrpB-like predicted nucleotidyltransferase (UPF0157 family)
MTTETHFRLTDPERARDRAERLFGQIRTSLQSVLPRADIRHVGATAIRGCLTKGDLDIVIRIPAEDFPHGEATLSKRFTRNIGSTRTTNFAAFEDASTDPPLGIQLTTINGPFDFFHEFVDALSASPPLVREYNALKSAHEGREMAVYRVAKDAFVERVLAETRVRR